jgi:hypothetical protein
MGRPVTVFEDTRNPPAACTAKPRPIRTVARWLVPFWIAAVVIGSFLPGSSKAYLGTKPNPVQHPVEFQHRLAHMLVFGITSLLFLLISDPRTGDVRAAGAAFLLGLLIEIGQVIFGLSMAFEWWDVRDDFIGVLLVFLLFQAASLALRAARS